MKKIQEIQTKKIESEIEQKRKAREVRNHHNQLRMCNEIYAKAFQFEKEKYIEETANQMELRRIENEEKRKAMMEIEKYYKDKIAILQELMVSVNMLFTFYTILEIKFIASQSCCTMIKTTTYFPPKYSFGCRKYRLV